jgi:hypothetical protein
VSFLDSWGVVFQCFLMDQVNLGRNFDSLLICVDMNLEIWHCFDMKCLVCAFHGRILID